MAKEEEFYPSFFKTKDSLIAVTSPTDCFVITQQGRNMNTGVCLDYYKTRKMVLSHYCGYGNRITTEQFKAYYEKINASYLDHIINQ